MNVSQLFLDLRTKYTFAISSLKKEQETVIDLVLRKKDVLVFFPTGFVKSMMYVLPPLLLDMVSVR